MPAGVFYGDGIIGAAFDRRIVDDDDALHTGDPADTRDDPSGGYLVGVKLESAEQTDLEERRTRIEQSLEPLPG